MNTQDEAGATPLHAAQIGRRGRRDVTEALVAHGAATTAQDLQGNTPLHRAIANLLGGSDETLINGECQLALGTSPQLCPILNQPTGDMCTKSKAETAFVSVLYFAMSKFSFHVPLNSERVPLKFRQRHSLAFSICRRQCAHQEQDAHRKSVFLFNTLAIKVDNALVWVM